MRRRLGAGPSVANSMHAPLAVCAAVPWLRAAAAGSRAVRGLARGRRLAPGPTKKDRATSLRRRVPWWFRCRRGGTCPTGTPGAPAGFSAGSCLRIACSATAPSGGARDWRFDFVLHDLCGVSSGRSLRVRHAARYIGSPSAQGQIRADFAAGALRRRLWSRRVSRTSCTGSGTSCTSSTPAAAYPWALYMRAWPA